MLHINTETRAEAITLYKNHIIDSATKSALEGAGLTFANIVYQTTYL